MTTTHKFPSLGLLTGGILRFVTRPFEAHRLIVPGGRGVHQQVVICPTVLSTSMDKLRVLTLSHMNVLTSARMEVLTLGLLTTARMNVLTSSRMNVLTFGQMHVLTLGGIVYVLTTGQLIEDVPAVFIQRQRGRKLHVGVVGEIAARRLYTRLLLLYMMALWNVVVVDGGLDAANLLLFRSVNLNENNNLK